MNNKNFLSPLMEPMEKDGLFLAMLIFISISSGITAFFYKSVSVIIMVTFLSSIFSVLMYCLIKNHKRK